jgi:F-type H+-transporting ATPase subunit delta
MVFRGRRSNAPDGIDLADDSNQTDVGARYAQALFDLALDNKAVDAVEQDLKALKAALAESAELRLALASPIHGADDKGKVLTAIGQQIGFEAITLNFIGVLAHNRRAAALSAVIAAYQRLSAAHRGVVAAEVTTAIKLTAAQAKGVQAALAQALGMEPDITTHVDPAILGGLKVKVGSRLFDASLRSKLDSLKFALKRA